MASKRWEKFHDQFKSKVNWEKVGKEVFELELIGSASADGWVSCRSIDGEDNNPSASFNTQSGYYKDHRDGEKAISPYDMAYQLGLANDYAGARFMIAAHFGVQVPISEKEDVEHGVTWQPWDDKLATQYCNKKKPVTVEGLVRAGARMCMRHGSPCFALPVVDYSGYTVGWMFIRRNGYPFELAGGAEPKAICKVHDKSNGAFVMNPEHMHSIIHRKVQVIWTEGAPDMLAGLSVFPDTIFMTNCHGAAENISWKGPDIDLALVSDCDKPGISGAFKRMRVNVDKIFRPPFDVSDSHGKDYRDYLFEKKPRYPLEGLEDITSLRKQHIEDYEKANSARMEKDRERAYSAAEDLLKSVGCRILMVDHKSVIKVFSLDTSTTKEIPSVSKIAYEDMIQFLGWNFQRRVLQFQRDVENALAVGDADVITFAEFKKALALAATRHEYRSLEEVGVGLWPVEDFEKEKTGEVLIVKSRAAYLYDGSLRKVQDPLVGRNCVDMSVAQDWFILDKLVNYLEDAKELDWRVQTYNELYTLFNQWRWDRPDMVQLAVGLYYATWIQTFFDWRPTITFTGESNSGKTTFMQSLEHLYIGLAKISAQSTAAGIIQSLGLNSQPLILDEFDSSEQQKILKIFRVSGRGQTIYKGTSSQTGAIGYRMHHIPWISGIHSSSNWQADANRQIQLRILAAPDNRRTISLPSVSELRDMGHKALASIIITSKPCLGLVQQLINAPPPKGDNGSSRYRESYAIPYGVLGSTLGIEFSTINDVMTDYLKNITENEIILSENSTDQEDLLFDIMRSVIKLLAPSPSKNATIGEILFEKKFENFRDECRTVGVAIIKGRERTKVAFAGKVLLGRDGVLRETQWDNVYGIHEILMRLPKDLQPARERHTIAGVNTVCVCVDYVTLRKWVREHELLEAA